MVSIIENTRSVAVTHVFSIGYDKTKSLTKAVVVVRLKCGLGREVHMEKYKYFTPLENDCIVEKFKELTGLRNPSQVLIEAILTIANLSYTYGSEQERD